MNYPNSQFKFTAELIINYTKQTVQYCGYNYNSNTPTNLQYFSDSNKISSIDPTGKNTVLFPLNGTSLWVNGNSDEITLSLAETLIQGFKPDLNGLGIDQINQTLTSAYQNCQNILAPYKGGPNPPASTPGANLTGVYVSDCYSDNKGNSYRSILGIDEKNNVLKTVSYGYANRKDCSVPADTLTQRTYDYSINSKDPFNVTLALKPDQGSNAFVNKSLTSAGDKFVSSLPTSDNMKSITSVSFTVQNLFTLNNFKFNASTYPLDVSEYNKTSFYNMLLSGTISGTYTSGCYAYAQKASPNYQDSSLMTTLTIDSNLNVVINTSWFLRAGCQQPQDIGILRTYPVSTFTSAPFINSNDLGSLTFGIDTNAVTATVSSLTFDGRSLLTNLQIDGTSKYPTDSHICGGAGWYNDQSSIQCQVDFNKSTNAIIKFPFELLNNAWSIKFDSPQYVQDPSQFSKSN